MADPIPNDAIADEDVRTEALNILEYEFGISTKDDDENAVIMAAAWFFEDLCEERDIDPLDALCQLLEITRPVMADDV